MVVSLSDLRAGKTSDTSTSNNQTGGVVRLSDVRKQAADQVVQNKTDQYKSVTANTNQFANDHLNLAAPIAPEKSTWNSVLDNPIVHGAAKAFDYGIIKPAESGYTAIADSLGALNNAMSGSHNGMDGQPIYPSEKRSLSQDLHDIWNNTQSSDHSALEGALPNDFLNNKRLYGTNQTLGSIENNILQAAIPVPGGDIIKGFKGASSKIGESFDKMFGKVKPLESTPIAQTGPILGLPEPKSTIMAREAQNRSVLPANTDIIHGQGNVATPETLGLPESQQYNQIQRIKSQQTLGLPEANPQTVADFNRRNGNVQPTNENPIYGKGNIADPLGLPQGNYVKPTRLKVSNPGETLSSVMTKIKPEVLNIIQAPTRRDLLIQYVQKNTQIPINEIHNMPLESLKQIGQNVQDSLHGNMQQIAIDVAKQYGHDLPALLEGQAPNLRAQLAKDTQSQVYGVPAEKVNVPRPKFNKEVIGQAAAPKQGLSFKRDPKLSSAKASTETPQQMQQRYEIQIKEANDRKRISELSKPIIGRASMPETKIKRLSELRQEVAATVEVKAKPIIKPKVTPINGTIIKKETVTPITRVEPIVSKPKSATEVMSDTAREEALSRGQLSTIGIQNKTIHDLNKDELKDVLQKLIDKKERLAQSGGVGTDSQLMRHSIEGDIQTVKELMRKEPVQQPRTTTVLPDEKIKGQQLKDLKIGDEVGFVNTVKNSEHTAPELKQALIDEPVIGARTTDVLNRQEASKIITKHGLEGTYDILMSKTKQFSAAENTAAQIVAKHLSSLGGEANLKKAINLVSKTAKGGREMGQAIQALTQWNKLDEIGALMLGEKQLNKGIKNTEDWKSLTVEQGAPITESAQRIRQAQDTKNLADEVLYIVTNKADGVALTEAEKSTIKQFQDQVKLINEKGKGILSKPKVDKANETIKEVSQIEPKARTRDQVVSFLDAKAEQARKRIAASRNIGFAAVNKGNPVIDYAIIGASHIAKGVVKLSDFTEAMVRDFGDSVKPHIDEAFNKATNIFRKENGLPTVEQLDKAVNAAVKNERFTPEQANQFKAWASEIGHYADKNLKVEATQDLQRALNEIGISTLGDKLSATQTAAQLLSVPTLIRNVVGNEAFNLVEKINKLAAAPIDWGLSKLTGERTLVFSAKNQEKYWDNFIKGLKGGWKGVSPNGQFEAFDIHPSAFKGDKNPLKYMQKALGAELQSFDHAAYMRAYGKTLGEYAKITGKNVEDLHQSIFDLADEAGRYATFQDDTFLSKLATGAKKLLNKPTDLLADALVHKGALPESLSWKGFGTGDLILKYAKTPANIVMRGIDYSPIGFLRGVGELLPLITGKTFNQRAATMALSRGITGTLGMTGLGYALVSAGILTGPSSSDPDIRSLDQQTGKGEYKVNWDALSRYVKGGFDKKTAQWQKGDNITDWGWLQPMAISISMGVNAQQSVEKQKTDGVKSYVGVAKDALVGSLKTIMQQPLLSGVQNLVSGATNVMRYGSWTGIANIFKGLPASFVPAALNQTRNFTDNTTRNTYDPSALKEALNMIINKIPGLDKKLPIAYDTLGGKREQVQGGQDKTLTQGAKTFLSPVKKTDYTVSPEAKMIIDLINQTGNEKVAPRTPNKYLMVNKRKVELTPAQYSEVQQKTGEATQLALSKLSSRLANPNMAEDKKAKLVIDTLNTVGDKVRVQLNKEYPDLKPKTPSQLRNAK